MIRRNSRPALCTLIIVLSLAGASSGQVSVRVNEAAIRIQIQREPKLANLIVNLPIENLSSQPVPARVLLELVGTTGAVQSHASREINLAPSSTTLKIPLPPVNSPRGHNEEDPLPWYRLRYSITPTLAGGVEGNPAKGIISVSEVTPQLFDLHVAGPASVRAGGHYTLRVRTIHPLTGRPVPGVTVQASLDIDSDGNKPLLTRKAQTNREGFAALAFTLPNTLDSDDEDEIDLKVTGVLGPISEEADDELRFRRQSLALLSTDKPLYQPGQTLHMRLLAFDNDKKAIADQPARFEIADPEDTLQYGAEVRTSRFGIASADWQIPESLRLGTYQIHAELEGDQFGKSEAQAEVKISRYELPTFVVTAKPDHTYYLPGQNAAVEVRADYLFGKPVRHGHVRVVRETERQWNYRDQKWDIKQAETYEGETDGEGRYVAHLDLTRDHDELEKNDYERFRDLRFAAYFTDTSTGRTEQRRFDARLTKEPIHIYVIGNASAPQGLPLDFYISTDYADGSPAACDVEVTWTAQKRGRSQLPIEQPLRRIHTNHYGVAKVSGISIPSEPESSDAFLSFRATDRKGAIGHQKEGLWYSDNLAIRVTTDKALYRPDDPIAVTIRANKPDLTVFLEAIQGSRVLSSQRVRVRGGQANLLLPPNAEFQDEVSVLAYGFGLAPDSDEYGPSLASSHTVLFPKNHELKLDVRPEKMTYRPGNEAAVDFHVVSPEGGPALSALGLVVVDKALEERQRTDEEFGARCGFYGFLESWGGTEEISGIRRSDLDKLDLTKPLPSGLEVVAEILLQQRGAYPKIFTSREGQEDLRKLFASEIDAGISPLIKALDIRYHDAGEYPKTEAALRSFLASAGLNLESVRDPWGQPYKTEFGVSSDMDVLTFKSAGPDKRFGTEDDFEAAHVSRPYFKTNADAIQDAVNQFHNRTGGYIRDIQTLKSELARRKIDLDSWKDPWGHPYRYTFGVVLTQFSVTVTSAGPDGYFNMEPKPSFDDFTLAEVGIDYTSEMARQFDAALARHFEKTGKFPQNVEDLQQAFQESGLTWGSFKDPWGHPYYATFRQEARYSDRMVVERYADHKQENLPRLTTVPVTRQINWVYFRSAGKDGIEGTEDDFDVAAFSRASLEQESQNKTPQILPDQTVLAGATGAISGTVIDQSGAVIPGAKITAKNLHTDQEYTGTADDKGKYTLRNLPAGFYFVQVGSPGFLTYAITEVPVRSSSVTQVDVTLRVGAVTQAVMVSAALNGVQLETSAAVAATKSGIARTSLSPQISTPRLRQYFPETLLWRPEVVTDGKGRARVKFPLADNITTWKLAVVASTVDGELGTAEKEIRAFQPFFIEHDPPPFLTSGDKIALPVVLRNYLDHTLQAKVAMQPEGWFTLADPTPKTIEIAPGDSAGEVFSFQAIAPAKHGKQKVTALSGEASDAIERRVTVRPNGKEETQTLSQVFRDTASLDLEIPAATIPGSLEVTLKVYPNLNAHVLESIEAIMARPHGCAEQAISSSYPSILYLRYAKGTEQQDSALSQRAQKYVQLGYERLLSYRAPDGGFSYWGRGEADLALTAYAIRFLSDASEFVAVDGEVVYKALSWLTSRAQPDGHWIERHLDGKEDVEHSVLVTAYIARMIAASGLTNGEPPKEIKQLAEIASDAQRKALDYLASKVALTNEPYLLADFALVALAAGERARAIEVLERLRQFEHREGQSSYWSLEMNTPFYGWGLAGRLETTALVLQALEKGATAGLGTQGSDELISRGLLFLLRSQDSYGVWYTTQATVDVLDAIAALTTSEGAQPEGAASKADILVDGKPAASLQLPAANKISAPLTQDLSAAFAPGIHRVEIKCPSGVSPASVQLVADYYLPWGQEKAESDFHHQAQASEALRLAVHFDKNSLPHGQEVQCSVLAERVGFRGYGMMLAEIGLPPGAEVERASLERAMKESGWVINQYDILPDRVVFYLWPRAGGVKFSFTFKQRFGLDALTTPSLLYDYYNPEARAVVAPTRFMVK